MSTALSRQPIQLKVLSNGFLAFWCILAAFPIVWITLMSLKVPLDAFASNPFTVIFGPQTGEEIGGWSTIELILATASVILLWYFVKRRLPDLITKSVPQDSKWLGWLVSTLVLIVGAIVWFFVILPVIGDLVNPFGGFLGDTLIGATPEHYRAVWVDREFTTNFTNSMLVTAGVVLVSLTVGTLAGYGLARSGSNLAFWLLIIALIFRALPHSVLVTGYLPVFIRSADFLRPIMGDAAPTLYGKPWAVIAVLVAINQPFTIWMLRSFFHNIPADLDEAARVDGCSHFQAFRRVIMPVMWPGVITAGLFSFLLAYNDFLVTSLLLDQQNMTMVPAIAGMFNRETTASDEVQAIAAAVSITAPLFVLVMVFQRQIVSGLTAGAVKG